MRLKPYSAKVIYGKLKLQQPVVSRHLNILKNAGIVQSQTGRAENLLLYLHRKRNSLIAHQMFVLNKK